MVLPTLKDLLEAGSHFGHQSKRWHPKMKSFIFTEREGIHVIDLEQTLVRLEKAADFLRDVASKGGKIVFVSTKEQAYEIVEAEAIRAGALFVTKRWIGGTLTNFETLKGNLKKLDTLEKRKESGELNKYTKKEKLLIDREIAKIKSFVGGLRDLEKLPDAVFILDTKREDNAVLESRKVGVPVVGVVDTNCDPTLVNYPIPANDDATKSIKLIVKTIADAVEEGYAAYAKENKNKPVEEKTDE